MKAFQQLRRQTRNRRMATVNRSPAEANRTAMQDALGYPVQTKLKVGSPEDAQEREADAVAEQVMAAPEGAVQRKCDTCAREDEEKKAAATEPDKEEVQRKETGGEATAASSADIAASRGGGQPLAKSERVFFEPRLGANLGKVRIHADDQAARLSAGLAARAFTVGGDVYFGRDEYQPGTREGRHLLAHELAHVAQQNGGEGEARRKIDKVSAGKSGLNLHFSLGIYGPRATSGLASTWASNIQDLWSMKLKFNGHEIDAKVHATVRAYPALQDMALSQWFMPESNAVFIEAKGVGSFVSRSCPKREKWSCGRWRVDAGPLVVAHEAGHMMGLDDKYKNNAAGGSVDLPGYETDIMANYLNDNGKTDFTRAWFGVLIYYFLGMRS